MSFHKWNDSQFEEIEKQLCNGIREDFGVNDSENGADEKKPSHIMLQWNNRIYRFNTCFVKPLRTLSKFIQCITSTKIDWDCIKSSIRPHCGFRYQRW